MKYSILIIVMLLGGCATLQQNPPKNDTPPQKCVSVDEFNNCVHRYNSCREILSKLVADSRDCVHSVEALQTEINRLNRVGFWARVREGVAWVGWIGAGVAILILLL